MPFRIVKPSSFDVKGSCKRSYTSLLSSSSSPRICSAFGALREVGIKHLLCQGPCCVRKPGSRCSHRLFPCPPLF